MTAPSLPYWTMVFLDLNGNPLGEIQDAQEREFKFNLYTPNTASFKLPLLSSQAPNILSEKEGLITLWRNKTLTMTAELSSVELVMEDEQHQLACVATETMFARLTKRLLGQSVAGLKGPTTATDQGTWMMARLDALNTADETGLRAGVVDPSGDITGGVWRYKPWMELFQELAATTAGFDFYQRPADPSVSVVTGRIDVAPVLGRNRPNVVFEFGDGAANASAASYKINNESVMNRGLVLPPSFPESGALKVAVASDATSEAARGRREEVVPSDLSDHALRTQLASLHVQLRKKPREQFTIKPAASDGTRRVPEFLDEYDVGDYIRGRVKDQGVLTLDADVRVYGATVKPNDEGQEDVTLTLVPETE